MSKIIDMLNFIEKKQWNDDDSIWLNAATLKKAIKYLRNRGLIYEIALDIICTETHFGDNPPSTTKTIINANSRHNAIKKAEEQIRDA